MWTTARFQDEVQRWWARMSQHTWWDPSWAAELEERWVIHLTSWPDEEDEDD